MTEMTTKQLEAYLYAEDRLAGSSEEYEAMGYMRETRERIYREKLDNIQRRINAMKAQGL